MPTYRKRGDGWRAEIVKLGVRDSATFPTKREAVAWATAREAEIATTRGGGIVRRTLAQVLAQYSRDESPKKRGEKWEQTRIAYYLRMEPELCARPISEITTGDLGLWRDRRMKEVKGSTLLRDIALLRAVWAIARKEWNYVAVDPWPALDKPDDAPARTRTFTDAELDRITQALGWEDGRPVLEPKQQTAVALLLAVETAMRGGEILSLTWDDVDLRGRVARLDQTKNGDARAVPLSTRAVQLLESLRGLSDERVFTITASQRDFTFRQGRALAGISGPTFHDSRATALTRLAKRLDILALAKMTGHRDPRSLMVYYRESPEDTALRLG